MSEVKPITSTEPLEVPRRRGLKLPAWLFLLLTLLAVGAGGYVVMKLVEPPPKVDLSQYQGVDQAQREAMIAQRRANAANRPNGGGRQMGNLPVAPDEIVRRANSVDVRVGGARARYVKAGDTWTVEPSFFNSQIGEPARTAARAHWAATGRPADAAAAKVTPEQVARLKAIPFPNQMIVSDADRAKLIDLFKQHEAATDADKPARAKELFDAFRAISSGARTPTMAANQKAADAVASVLSAEQLKALSAR